jgi:hypothetical protein
MRGCGLSSPRPRTEGLAFFVILDTVLFPFWPFRHLAGPVQELTNVTAKPVRKGTPDPAFVNAASEFAMADEASRGAVFTRREVVDLILDLVGYTADRDLSHMRLLEPAAGHGDFLIPAVERLVESYRRERGSLEGVAEALGGSFIAFEVNPDALKEATRQVTEKLAAEGVPKKAATALATRWLVVGDFLTADITGQFTHVVGNPPYVRQEAIPGPLLAHYRERYPTMFDRADLYIPFFERSFELLAPGGSLGFICTDRWTKNRYGGPLRQLISEHMELRHFVDLVDTQPFTTDVMTYPAITVIERPVKKAKKSPETRVSVRPAIDADGLRQLADDMRAVKIPKKSPVIGMVGVVNGREPWVIGEPGRLDLVRRLESTLPTLAEAGCKVGIGVATGADAVYIRPLDELDVEPSRKVPLVQSGDLINGGITWRGAGVLNPFGEDGKVVDLAAFPRFAKYIEAHADAISRRNVAKKNKAGWFRTIDRIYPELVRQPKLLIPDIKGGAHITFDEGKYYPHHNLYFITSDDWDLRALQAVLLSGIATLFVATYSTTMRGGYLRFQAQYLRRIRLPMWGSVPDRLRKALHAAGVKRDLSAANTATAELYGVTVAELEAISNSYKAKDAKR